MPSKFHLIISQGGETPVWIRPILPRGSLAVAFLNLRINSGGAIHMSISLSQLGLNQQEYNVTEGFTGHFITKLKQGQKLNVMVNPTGVYIVVAKPI